MVMNMENERHVRRIRKEVRILDVPFWGKSTSMFFQVYMSREAKGDSDLFKIMIRFRKKGEQKITDEIILKFSFSEIMTIFSYLNENEVPEEFIDKKDGSLKLIHPDLTTNKQRKVIKFKLDNDNEDQKKRGTLLISVADYTNVIKKEAKKPLVMYKRLQVSEVEIFKKLIGNIIETLIQATINYNMFNKYYKFKIRDIVEGKTTTHTNYNKHKDDTPEIEEELSTSDDEFTNEVDIDFEEEF